MSLLTLTKPKSAPSELPVITEDVYTLRLTGHGDPVDVPDFNDQTKMRTRVRLDFEITDHNPDDDEIDLNGTRVSEFFTLSLHEKSKLYPVVRALLGRDIEDDEKIELPDLIGGRMRATVRTKPNGYPEIVNPMPVKAKKKKPVDDGDADGEPPF